MQELGKVHPAATDELIRLGAAGEPVCEVDGFRSGPAQGGQQGILSDRDGDVVVPDLHAEVAGEPAAPPHRRSMTTSTGITFGYFLNSGVRPREVRSAGAREAAPQPA